MSNAPEFIRDEAHVVPTYVQAPIVETPYAAPSVVAPVAQTIVAPPVAAAPVVSMPLGTRRTSYTQRFAPDAVVAAIAGLFITLVGLLAVTRGGFDGPMDTPVVSVLGFTHTTLLGLIEAVIGVCLLLSGAARSRSGALFFGSVLGIGAFVGAVQTKSFRRTLALESGLAWLMVFIAVVVVLTALLLPRYQTRHTTVGAA
ncbi:MAG: hypothetical protein JWN62_647 [Acidimicrobiales bacterium]|nr:hypothetical protein [Acidimicrobiales bacterium]